MSFENRGGVPYVTRQAITTTGTVGTPGEPGLKLYARGPNGVLLAAITKYLVVSNEGANAIRLYFNQTDFDADTNYIELAASTGYYEQPDEVARIWLRALVGTSNPVVIKWNARRG